MEIRLPNITAQDDAGKIAQLQSYLFQLAGELQYAQTTVETMAEKAQEEANLAVKAAGKRETPLGTFNSIKALIIKSADIVNAYTEKISQELRGEYVAVSDFGTYQRETEQLIQQTAEGIRQDFTSLETIVQGTEESLQNVTAYIQTGQIGTDDSGAPIYGVEIGQHTEGADATTFQRFVRLVSDRMSFFDENGYEVAYISSQKLHITSAEADDISATNVTTDKLILGDYTLSANADGHLTLT